MLRRSVLVAGFALLAMALVRTAWVADDAFISLRTADNWLNGYGLVWNVDERVQSYTHPLWLVFLTLSYAAIGNGYFSTIAISLVTSLAAVWLLAVRVASTPWNLVLCYAALLSSKAFLDYSTSGLENPLSNALLVAFVWQWWEARATKSRLLTLSTLGALCTLNRLDLLLIVGPPLLYEIWRAGPRHAWRPMLIGWAPVIGWEVFSVFYYGLAVPNTALAKLTLAMPASLRVLRGVDYAMRTIESDPATLPVMVLAVATVAMGRRSHWPIAAGIALYVGYVVSIGGDFMMGRFFVAPFITSVALLGRAEWATRRSWALAAATAVVALGLAAPWEPALLGGYGYSSTNNRVRGLNTPEPADNYSHMVRRSVVDERRRYSEFTGLLIMRRDGIPEHGWKYDGFELRANGPRVVSRKFIGMVGFYAGPGVHIVDELALADPLLARIPGGDERSLMGHLTRVIPEGYIDTVESGRNQIVDRDLAAYYEALHEVVSGPLWSPHRLQTLVMFLMGRYDGYLNAYLERHKNDRAPEIAGNADSSPLAGHVR